MYRSHAAGYGAAGRSAYDCDLCRDCQRYAGAADLYDYIQSAGFFAGD